MNQQAIDSIKAERDAIKREYMAHAEKLDRDMETLKTERDAAVRGRDAMAQEVERLKGKVALQAVEQGDMRGVLMVERDTLRTDNERLRGIVEDTVRMLDGQFAARICASVTGSIFSIAAISVRRSSNDLTPNSIASLLTFQ